MEQHCCKWNEYIPNLLTGMENMKTAENYVDVTLVCEGNAIKVHKLVLSTCSTLFHKMFLSNPCAHPVIILHDMKFTILQEIINFIYRGEVNVPQDELELLLKAAKALEIKGLSNICKETMLKAMIADIEGESHNDIFINDSSPESCPMTKRVRKQLLEYNIPVETNLKVENESEDSVEFNPQITEAHTVSMLTIPSLPSVNDSLPLVTNSMAEITPSENDVMMHTEEKSSSTKQPNLGKSRRKKAFSKVKASEEESTFESGRKKKKSFVWNYFTKLNEHIAACNFCSLNTHYRSQISNLERHLRLKHPSIDLFKTQQNQNGVQTDSKTEQTDQEQQSNIPVTEIKIDSSQSNRKRTSHIWKYFTRKDGMMAECNTCLLRQSYLSSISNLKKHLLRRHPSIYFPDKTKGSDENEELPAESTDEAEIASQNVAQCLMEKADEKERPRTFSPVEIKNRKPFVPSEKRLKNVGHIPKRTGRRRCAHCSSSKAEHRTFWMCETCEVPLCLQKTGTPCFTKFHQK